MPQIFSVNWFRKDREGKFLWPGFGENIRVIKWMFERIEEKVPAKDEAIGYLPVTLDTAVEKLLTVDRLGYLDNIQQEREYFSLFGDQMPKELMRELDEMEKGLS